MTDGLPVMTAEGHADCPDLAQAGTVAPTGATKGHSLQATVGGTLLIDREGAAVEEAGMHRSYDALWVVTAPRPVQIARLVATRGLDEGEAALRVDAQPPQEEKAVLADVVLVNDSDLAALRERVKAAWAQMQANRTR